MEMDQIPSMTKDQLISWVEILDSEGYSPLWLVKQIEIRGFSRPEAIELYREATLAWTFD